MFVTSFPILAAWANAAIFLAAGLVNLAGFRSVRAVYAQWDIPPRFYRTLGFVEIVAAAFLAMPDLRIWGGALAVPIAFGSVVMLLEHRHYLKAMSGAAMTMALLIGILAIPASRGHVHYATTINTASNAASIPVRLADAELSPRLSTD